MSTGEELEPLELVTADLVERLREAGSEKNAGARFLDRGAALVATLCARVELFPLDFFRPLSRTDPTAYPLRQAADPSLFMVVYVWPAGARGLPHDHGTWAIMGCVHGVARERVFTLETGVPAGHFLHIKRDDVLSPTETSVLSEHEFHSVENHGKQELVEFNVYGRNISIIERREFDIRKGTFRGLQGPGLEPWWTG